MGCFHGLLKQDPESTQVPPPSGSRWLLRQRLRLSQHRLCLGPLALAAFVPVALVGGAPSSDVLRFKAELPQQGDSIAYMILQHLFPRLVK